ncbi:MAG: sel1 repeat family protein [Hyphomicrobiales bacterium]|nr:sel1 repeat family protein [Hyphomicrobiales bacterium]
MKKVTFRSFILPLLLAAALTFSNGVLIIEISFASTQYLNGFSLKQAKPGDDYASGTHILLSKHQADHEDVHYFLELFRWNRLAAINGNLIAQYKLGVMYRDGLGTSLDYEKAAEWFERSAGQGHELAQYNLGVMYRDGLGVAQDYDKAMAWLFLSSEQGNAAAKYNIGAMYHFGKGVKQNHETAFGWYLRGAEQGDEDSQYNLGWMYATGQGVRQDKISAYMWLDIVAAKGDLQAANLRDAFGKEMSAIEITQSKGLARECELKRFKGC